MDLISELLALMDARCVIAGGVRAGGDWSFGSTLDAPVKLEAVVGGACWCVADDGPAVRLETGDAVVLNGVDRLVLCSDPSLTPTDSDTALRRTTGVFSEVGDGDEVLLIGGHVEIDSSVRQVLASALPPVLHVRAASPEAGEIHHLLGRIADEFTDPRPGAHFAAGQLAQLLLVQVLRVGMADSTVVTRGQLALLADAQLRPALVQMHSDPGRPWRLAELAGAAAMSRSHFAERFRTVAGQPPLTYLSHLRIALARQALRTTDTNVAVLAADLGYASESSFSHAFTRIVGIAPNRYRRRAEALV